MSSQKLTLQLYLFGGESNHSSLINRISSVATPYGFFNDGSTIFTCSLPLSENVIIKYQEFCNIVNGEFLPSEGIECRISLNDFYACLCP